MAASSIMNATWIYRCAKQKLNNQTKHSNWPLLSERMSITLDLLRCKKKPIQIKHNVLSRKNIVECKLYNNI